ncbi:helix-turn-helix domain-containing protein [Abyssogena phaseoliformis symbiont]|uniref:helix-turn-helix domain-containing protein n=1 Tax=Abyssogena phaseoliformis symbiont TaxID=596095 RepID=UPI0019154C20|nr:AraC family transcriptional regulator [Abyssogena phaseoliformis symbiont]
MRLLRKQGRDLLLDYARKEPDVSGISAMIDYLKNNIDQSFDIDKLTRKACVSRSSLYTEFKNKLGCTPCEFYWKLRLYLAEKMLQNGKSVTYVCYSVGFKDLGYFSQLFGYTALESIKRVTV